MTTRKFITRALAALIITTQALAGPPQWYSQIYPSNTNSQITLTDSGNNSITAITNPTAASVRTNANTNTQPPVVIVQATATLPVVAIGSTCVFGTNTAALSSSDRITLLTCGSNNLWAITNRVALKTVSENSSCNIATDGNIAVTSAGLTLSCQSGAWKKATGSGSGFSGVLGPLNGKTISCGVYGGYYTAYGSVQSGVFYAQSLYSGWKPGTSFGATASYPVSAWQLKATVTINGLSAQLLGLNNDLLDQCNAAWPST